MSRLTHFDEHGRAHMVDVGAKGESERHAIAEGRILMQGDTLERIRSGGHKKGDVLGVARIAGIMAAKKTGELVPLCHPLALTAVSVEFDHEESPPAIRCTATVSTRGRTGVEMEALTAVEIALLTVYDMCKSVDRGMTLEGIRLMEKSGGKSGLWKRPQD